MTKNKETIYAIHFYINMSSAGKLGSSMIMTAIPVGGFLNLMDETEEKSYLSVIGNPYDGSLSISVGKSGKIYQTFSIDNVLNGDIFISSVPLREDIWELDVDVQKRILDRLKYQESSKMLGYSNTLISDLNRLDIILDRYTTKEKSLNAYIFAQVSDIYHTSITTYD